MTFTEITFEYCQGKVFVCKPKIEELEIELDSKMKGGIVSVSQPNEEDVVIITVDTSDFVDHNNFYAKANYYKPGAYPALLPAKLAGGPRMKSTAFISWQMISLKTTLRRLYEYDPNYI